MEDQTINKYEEKDLARSYGSLLQLWGPPIALIILAPIGTGQGWWSPFTEVILWSIATAWIGISCYINGRRCGRVHCKILGILFPILGAVGVLAVLGAINLDFNILNITFWAILIGSFIPEFFGKKYI